jgi:hypothetical protein
MWSAQGFPYRALRDFNPAILAMRGLPPSRGAAEHWLLQLTLLLPVAVFVRAAMRTMSRRGGGHITLEFGQVTIAAAVVMIAALRLFREDSYFVVVLPLSAAFGAQLLAGSHLNATRGHWRILQQAFAGAMLLVTITAVVGYVAAWDLLKRSETHELAPAFRQLLITPPIDGLLSADTARHLGRADWLTSDANARQKIVLRYLHDCTAAGDRILVTGSTPYQVAYYTERSIAGGHIEWHHGWRSEPKHVHESLELLQHQSVPFAFSTDDPVLVDLEKYPEVHRYFEQNYVELEGSDGLVLVDRRRHPTGPFGALGFPCFR